MGKEKADQARQKQPKAPGGKALTIFLNLLGILSAFGIAFGGLLFVHGRLVREEAELLGRGGSVEIQVQAEPMPVLDTSGEEQALLTDRQLYRVIEAYGNRVEAYPHEPWEGQLSMAEAAACGREWVEGFLLPHMGVDGYELTEYSMNCHLWAWQEDVEAGLKEPAFSYWNVWFESQGITVSLTLNAVTGQVLSASAMSSLLMEYQEEDQVTELLQAYADSFGLGGQYLMYYGGEETVEGGQVLYRSIGEEGVFASVRTSSIAVAGADGGYSGIREFFTVQLKLCTDFTT